MVAGVPLTVTSANIALFSRKNENSLAKSLINLASGKRINRPSDGLPDYFYSERLKQNSRSSEHVLRSIEDAQAFADVASGVGETVFNALTDMRELVKEYYRADADADEKAAVAAEFESLKSTVTGIIQASKYDGMTIMSDNGGTPFKEVTLDENRPALMLSLSYNNSDDIADVTTLSIGTTDEATELAAVATERGKAGSYLAKTSAYERGLNAHYAIVNNKITTESANAERIVEVATGEEYMSAMNKSIRNQSSLAMLAQANMYRTSVVKLFG